MPFGIQVDFVAIGVAEVAVDGVVVEIHRADLQVFQWRDFQCDVLDARVGVERAGVVAGDFTLEPGAISAAETVEQRVIAFREPAVAVADIRRPGDVGKGPAGFQVPGVFGAGVGFVLLGVFAGEEQVFHPGVACRAQAVGLHAVAFKLQRGGVLLVDIGGVDVGQADRAGFGDVFERADVHFGLGLGAVVRFQPHQVAAPAFLATQTQHGGLVEGFARGQPVGASTVELAVGQAFAQVERVAINQEAVTDHDVLAAEGQVHAVLTEHVKQLARAPAEVGVFELGGAFRTVAEAGGIAVAPGAGTEQVRRAIRGAHTGQAFVEAQAVFDVALAPRRGTLVEAAGQRVVFLAVENAEYRFQGSVQVTVVIGIEFVGAGLAGTDHQRESRETKQGGLEHGVASVLVLERRFAVFFDTKARNFFALLCGCQRVGCACQIARFGSPANTTGTQGKTCVPPTIDNPYQPCRAPVRYFSVGARLTSARIFKVVFLCSPPCDCPSSVCSPSPWRTPRWPPSARRTRAMAPRSSPMNAGSAIR